jgi:hypothetical protein
MPLDAVKVVIRKYVDDTQPGFVECCLVDVRRRDAMGREVATVSTEMPWDVAATTGETSFEVLADQLATIA